MRWPRPGADFGQADLGIRGSRIGLTKKCPKNGDYAGVHTVNEDGPFKYQISSAQQVAVAMTYRGHARSVPFRPMPPENLSPLTGYPDARHDIYKFIPTNFTEIKKPKAKMYEAGFVFAARTKDTVEKILKWYVLCALEEDCMAGNQEEKMHCGFKGDRFSEPPKCHRFDQSVVNLLAANAFYYDRHYYASEIVDFFSIERKLPS
ncbi:unnamed protein product [Angiostrongylus costaricensis]|uniref:Astacin domain-containing protein n=1 Tax=Angiostrongylus costaricensis TaxID=334426 RepID=A0A158PIE6_ANGCS|nr:unnamed protein product [Angiostrongylus costaricensis]